MHAGRPLSGDAGRHAAGSGGGVFQPARLPLRRPAAARLPADRPARRRGRARHRFRQRRRRLFHRHRSRSPSSCSIRASARRFADVPARRHARRITLATVGVVLTTLVFGVRRPFVLGLSWLESLLLGAIVSSTDAAAVFFLLRIGGLTIRDRVRATLEIESGSNDPMAIFLTIDARRRSSRRARRGTHAPRARPSSSAFVAQMGLGAVAGYRRRHADRRAGQPARASNAGSDPVFALGLALLVFAIAGLARRQRLPRRLRGRARMPATASIRARRHLRALPGRARPGWRRSSCS